MGTNKDFFYSPPAWQVCAECGGYGYKKVNAGPSVGSMKYGRKDSNCQKCNGTGRIPIHYTPEQWEEAGGVLSEDTPVLWRWMESNVWHCGFLGLVPSRYNPEKIIIIATEAGKPPTDDWNG